MEEMSTVAVKGEPGYCEVPVKFEVKGVTFGVQQRVEAVAEDAQNLDSKDRLIFFRMFHGHSHMNDCNQTNFWHSGDGAFANNVPPYALGEHGRLIS